MDAYEKALRQSGVSSDTIQTAVRFARAVSRGCDRGGSTAWHAMTGA